MTQKKLTLDDVFLRNGPVKIKPAITDWSETDNLLFQTCPEIIVQPMILMKTIQNEKILEKEGIDATFILNTLTSIKKDAIELNTQLHDIQAKYRNGKNLVLEEDALMFIMEISQEATDWAGRAEETVTTVITDLIDYINSFTSNDEKTETTTQEKEDV